MGLDFTSIVGKLTTAIPNLKVILITAAIVAPIAGYSGYHLKGIVIDAGQTKMVVKANKALVKDGERSADLGAENINKKETYDAKVKTIEPVPADGPTFDAGFVRRLSQRIDAGKASR